MSCGMVGRVRVLREMFVRQTVEASPAQSGGAVAAVGDRDGQAASRTFVDRAVAQCCAELYCGASFTESCGLIKARWERLWTGEEESGQERGMHVFPMLSRGGCKAMDDSQLIAQPACPDGLAEDEERLRRRHRSSAQSRQVGE
jgi:hypothetical protein